MKRLFVHSPRFRLVSPIFSGIVVYLLLLLLNNNVEALSEQFLGQELYFCILLAYVIQEFSRLAIIYFTRWSLLRKNWIRVFVASLVSIVITISFVTGAMSIYYHFLLGFSPNSSELITFNIIFTAINLIYITLHVSYDLLERIHQTKLNHEQARKEQIQADFQQFRRGLNPKLLLESLENLILLAKYDKYAAENFIDDFAQVYRYVLSKRHELVSIHTEYEILIHLVHLFNQLPSRSLKVESRLEISDFLVVPGVLLKLVESIMRDAIANPNLQLEVFLTETEDDLVLSASFIKSLRDGEVDEVLNEIKGTYALYSEKPITHRNEIKLQEFKIPKLKLAI
ncbi:MAG: histidine kinase [Cyclobacteriaceae bacterium]